MPIVELYVEGILDSMIANAVRNHDGYKFGIVAKGSKDGLRSKVIATRGELGRSEIFMLRDRDFDYDVEHGIVMPRTILHENQVIGWHWCRHEAENYLLEPAIFSRFLSLVTGSKITVEEVEEEIRQAATSIRYYQAARWTMGISKRRAVLPPPHDLKTRPEKVKEFKLPSDLGRGWSEDWVITATQHFLQRVEETLGRDNVANNFQQFEQRFGEQQCQDVNWVLHTFSGKDLFVALKPWFVSLGVNSSIQNIIMNMAEWIEENADLAVDAIEEWRALLGEFRKFA